MPNTIKIKQIPLIGRTFFERAQQLSVNISRTIMATLKTYVDSLATSLEAINKQKDEFLFSIVKPYWPRWLTPNILTSTRIVIGIFLFVWLFNFRNDNGLIVLPLFLIGILTDLFDGVVARAFGLETKFGQVIDPIADRVLIIPVAVYAVFPHMGLLVILLVMEVLNALISLMAQGKNVFSGSNIFGKTKMVLQSVVLLAILLFWPAFPNIFFLNVLWLSAICMVISLAIKFNSMRLYYQKNVQGKNIQQTS